MQVFWNKFAFVRLVIWIIAGIILGAFLPHYATALLVVFISSFFCYLIFSIKWRNYVNDQRSAIIGFLAFLICLSIGYLNAYNQSEVGDQMHLSNQADSAVTAFKVFIDSKPKEKSKSVQFEARIKAVRVDSTWKKYESNIMLYFEKSAGADTINYGDEIIVNSPINPVAAPKNPMEFNYKRFLSFDQIYYQQYVAAENFIKIGRNHGNYLISASLRTSRYLANLLAKYITDSEALSIAQALTLGVKDDLNDQIKKAYASAGAMHVLAVSGLHVGIIFLIISALFKPWKHRPKGRFVFAICSILGLWAFAFITGLSPSVLRAATMFSFIIVGQAFKRHTNIYNTLAASAFLLLVFDPFLIFSVGFQLSYLAVFGIVFFQPRIYKLLAVKSKILDKVWSITAVSIAAQLATAPLSLLYFHQFPTYFFLSNLVVIPAAFLILNGSILLLLLSWWDGLAQLLGLLIDKFIQSVNYLIYLFNGLPASTMEGIYINVFESWLLYIILLLFAIFVAHTKMTYWISIFATGTILICSISYRHFASSNVKKLTVYHANNKTALSVRNGFNQTLILSDALKADTNSFRFHIYPSQLRAGIANLQTENSDLPNGRQLFKTIGSLKITVWNDLKICLLEEEYDAQNSFPAKPKIDYLIVSNNAGMRSAGLFNQFDIHKVIIDASNNYYEIQRLEKKLDELGIYYYTIREKGAFELEI